MQAKNFPHQLKLTKYYEALLYPTSVLGKLVVEHRSIISFRYATAPYTVHSNILIIFVCD
jgi:hypothetical protein